MPAYADWGIDADTRVYHYHAQLKPPYLLGCYGPVASVAACKDLYAAGTRKCDAAAADVRIGESYSLEYDLFCPCYDGYEVPEHVVTAFEGTDVAPAGDAPARPASAAPRGDESRGGCSPRLSRLSPSPGDGGKTRRIGSSRGLRTWLVRTRVETPRRDEIDRTIALR